MSEPLRFVMLIWPVRFQDRMAGLIVLDMMPQGLGTTASDKERGTTATANDRHRDGGSVDAGLRLDASECCECTAVEMR